VEPPKAVRKFLRRRAFLAGEGA